MQRPPQSCSSFWLQLTLIAIYIYWGRVPSLPFGRISPVRWTVINLLRALCISWKDFIKSKLHEGNCKSVRIDSIQPLSWKSFEESFLFFVWLDFSLNTSELIEFPCDPWLVLDPALCNSISWLSSDIYIWLHSRWVCRTGSIPLRYMKLCDPENGAKETQLYQLGDRNSILFGTWV